MTISLVREQPNLPSRPLIWVLMVTTSTQRSLAISATFLSWSSSLTSSCSAGVRWATLLMKKIRERSLRRRRAYSCMTVFWIFGSSSARPSLARRMCSSSLSSSQPFTT